jgi:hypothetical protein
MALFNTLQDKEPRATLRIATAKSTSPTKRQISPKSPKPPKSPKLPKSPKTPILNNKSSSPKKSRYSPIKTHIQDGNCLNLTDCNQFIKLIGRPPPNSDDAITMPPYNVAMGDPRKYCIDVLEAENEDPFTLESLKDLIRMHAKSNLDFVIARVCTGI